MARLKNTIVLSSLLLFVLSFVLPVNYSPLGVDAGLQLGVKYAVLGLFGLKFTFIYLIVAVKEWAFGDIIFSFCVVLLPIGNLVYLFVAHHTVTVFGGTRLKSGVVLGLFVVLMIIYAVITAQKGMVHQSPALGIATFIGYGAWLLGFTGLAAAQFIDRERES